jgi:hypothetical protein
MNRLYSWAPAKPWADYDCRCNLFLFEALYAALDCTAMPELNAALLYEWNFNALISISLSAANWLSGWLLGGKSFPTECGRAALVGSKLNCFTISGDGDYFQREERLTAVFLPSHRVVIYRVLAVAGIIFWSQWREIVAGIKAVTQIKMPMLDTPG